MLRSRNTRGKKYRVPRDEVVAVLVFLETCKGHLCSWNVLLWVFKAVEDTPFSYIQAMRHGDLLVEKGVLIPVNGRLLVGFSV